SHVTCFLPFFFSTLSPHLRSTLFPYTTLFRSNCCAAAGSRCRGTGRTNDPDPTARKRISASWDPDRGRNSDHAPESHPRRRGTRSEEHTPELQSLAYLVCRLLLEKKNKNKNYY